MKTEIELNEILGNYVEWIKDYSAVHVDQGLAIHVRNHHPDCVEYLSCIEDIVSNPDYIGINPNVQEQSFELVRTYDENVLIGIKLDVKNNRLYVASLYTITNSKVHHRLDSGRMMLIE